MGIRRQPGKGSMAIANFFEVVRWSMGVGGAEATGIDAEDHKTGKEHRIPTKFSDGAVDAIRRQHRVWFNSRSKRVVLNLRADIDLSRHLVAGRYVRINVVPIRSKMEEEGMNRRPIVVLLILAIFMVSVPVAHGLNYGSWTGCTNEPTLNTYGEAWTYPDPFLPEVRADFMVFINGTWAATGADGWTTATASAKAWTNRYNYGPGPWAVRIAAGHSWRKNAQDFIGQYLESSSTTYCVN